MALESFCRTFGLGTVEVACSFETDTTNAPVNIRDGKSSIVTSVARTAAGRYTVTFARGLGRLVAGTVGINAAAAGTSQAVSYVYTDAIPSTLEIRTFLDDATSGVPALADLPDTDRVSFIGVFSPRSDLRDAA